MQFSTSSKRFHHARRSAFTLIEILLVLAILVAVAAVAVPALHGPLENRRLRSAGDQVHMEWNRARNHAMKTGQVHVFQFQPRGNTYDVHPWIGSDDHSTTADAQPGGFGTPQPKSQAASGPKQLPENVTFYAGDAASDARSASAEQQLGGATKPILFYPDGTTSTARVTLVNLRQHYVTITLRGLTGISHVSDLLDAADLPR